MRVFLKTLTSPCLQLVSKQNSIQDISILHVSDVRLGRCLMPASSCTDQMQCQAADAGRSALARTCTWQGSGCSFSPDSCVTWQQPASFIAACGVAELMRSPCRVHLTGYPKQGAGCRRRGAGCRRLAVLACRTLNSGTCRVPSEWLPYPRWIGSLKTCCRRLAALVWVAPKVGRDVYTLVNIADNKLVANKVGS